MKKRAERFGEVVAPALKMVHLFRLIMHTFSISTFKCNRCHFSVIIVI